MVPNLPSSSNQPSTAPGTVTVSGPLDGITFDPAASRTTSAVAATGARPEPLYAHRPSASRDTMANRSPP